MRRWGATLLLALAAFGRAASGQERGSELTVYVVTVGQGDQVWERFGHNALWIRDTVRGTNDAYNWGIFDASEAGFILRFVRGRMQYWTERVDVVRLLDFYRTFDRSITIQRLALTPSQRVALRDFAEWNAREENKYYWYDYYRDNCSTRLRDAVDRALGGALRAATTGILTTNTYRSESVRLMEGMPLTQAGMAIGLGPRADRPLTAWEEMFIPMRLRDRLREIRVAGPGGAYPLVAEEREVYVARRAPEIQHAPPLAWRYAAVGIAAALLLAGVAWRAGAGGRTARAGLAIALAAWAGVVGIGGLVLVFLWAGTHHAFAHRNWNILQIDPAALALAVLAPVAVYRPRRRAAARRLALVIVAVSVVGAALKMLPWVSQDNLPAIALVLPAHIALAWGLWRLSPTPVAESGAAPERRAAAPPSGDATRRAASP